MPQRKTDVEAYVLSTDVQGIEALLSAALACEVSLKFEPDVPWHYWANDASRVVLQEAANHFTSVYVIGEFPWQSEPEFARLLAAQLSCVVRCDPGAEYPLAGPCSFLEINGDIEQLIEWQDDEAQ